MKGLKILTRLFLLFICSEINAQVSDFDPYNEALKEFVTDMVNENQHIVYDTIYVQKRELVTDKLTNELKCNNKIIHIRLVSSKELVKEKLKFVLDVTPMFFIDGKPAIDILYFSVKIKKRKVYATQYDRGGIRYDFQYDCNTNKFYIKKNENF